MEDERKASEGNVLVTITKFGEGKVSTGTHAAGEGDVMAKRGDVIEVDADTAKSMESRGLGEIVE